MTRLSDEVLMAYADEALEPKEKVEVDRMLETDPEARETVRRLRLSRDLLVEGADEIMRRPIPQAMLETVLGTGGNVTSLHRPGKVPASWRRVALPLAASLVLVAGASTLVLQMSGGADTDRIALGLLPASGALATLLEKQPSGELITLAMDGGATRHEAVVLSTFRDAKARACREFEVVARAPATASTEVGIACREPTQGWVVVGAAQAPAARAGEPTFVPAADHSDDPLAKLFEQIGAGSQLTSTEEATLLKSGWR